LDNVCHSLAGAAIAQAGFARRLPRTTILGVIAANIPDVDAFAYFGADSATAVAFRRGITHGLPALAIWTLLLSLAFAWLAKRWPRETLEPKAGPLTAVDFAPLAAIAVVSHPSLDWLNNYGVRFLAPFSDRWFYGDTLFIIDPVLVMVFGLGWALSRLLLARRARWSPVPARIALACGLAYIAWMKAMSEITRGAAAEAYGLIDPSPRELMVSPPTPFFQYFRRGVWVSDGQRVKSSAWRISGLRAERASARESIDETRADSAVVAAVLATRDGANFLLWSRFPYFLPDSSTGTVFVGDMRYSRGDTESWAGVRIHTGAIAGR
jgi:inner membrane protein